MKEGQNPFKMPKAERAKFFLKVTRQAERELKGLDKPKSQAIINLGKSLNRQRKARGLTLEGLQERTQINKSHLVRMENGKINPTIETLLKIAEAMNCKLEINFVRKKSKEDPTASPNLQDSSDECSS